MPHYVAFLRAINVGGRFIKMQVLARHFETLGYRDVETFINSGNVLFRSPLRSAPKIASSIELAIAPLLGFRSEVFVRGANELAQIAARADSLNKRLLAPGECNVAFLNQTLSADQTAAIQTVASDIDQFEVDGYEVYWLCRVKQSESKFSNAVLERKLKLKATFRRASMLGTLSARLNAR